MSIATERRERTAADIAFTCRVNRLVDRWIVRWHLGTAKHLDLMTREDWYELDREAGSRNTDIPTSIALRFAVAEAVKEIILVRAGLDRRRRGTA